MYKPAHTGPPIAIHTRLPQTVRQPPRSYQYKQFDDPGSQIRLLRFLPSNQSGTLRCTLETYSLKDKPQYTATSYEWGDIVTETEVKILVDNQDFFIGQNLWRLFGYLQRSKPDGDVADPFRVWVDAICIDQNDLEEKTAQIQVMSQVFGQAHQVLAWLDQTVSFDVQKTFNFIRTLAFHANSRDSLETARFIGLIPEEHGREATHSGLRASEAWRSVLKLCRLSYWDRRWIIQEIISARNPTLLCSGEEVSWSALQAVMEFVDKHLTPPTNPPSERYTGIRASWWQILRKIESTNIWKIYRLRSQLRASDTAPSLKTLMTVFASSECQLLHDRAYALLNLTRERNSINVQYSYSTFELFKEIFRHAHQYSGRDWPLQLMKILELDKDIVPLPRPSHTPVVPVRLAARQLMCVSHVFHSSSKTYLRELTKTGQKVQDELGTREAFERHYRISDFKHQRIRWRGNYLVQGSATQLAEMRKWSSIVSSWPTQKLDKILTIIRNIEDTCPAQISGTRLVLMNNGGLAYAIGEVQSADIVVPNSMRGTSAVLVRSIGEGPLLAVGAVALGPNLGEKWPELVRNWYTLGVKSPPWQYLCREESIQDDGSLTLFMDAASFIGMYRRSATT